MISMAPSKSDQSVARVVNPNKASSFDLGHNKVTTQDLHAMAAPECQWFERELAEKPRPNETSPYIRLGYAIVFKKFFLAGLRFPCSPFVGDVLSYFNLEIHETTPTTLVQLAAYEWAFHQEGCVPNTKAFPATHLASQREHPALDRIEGVAAFISVTLQPRDKNSVPVKATKEHWGK